MLNTQDSRHKAIQPVLRWLRVCLLAVALLASPLVFGAIDASGLVPGTTLVDHIKGTVMWQNPHTKEYLKLDNGSILQGVYIIETADDSEATLMFSNGTGLQLFPKTRVSVSGFIQAPTNIEPEDFRSLDADPAPSYASVYVEHGRILGHTEKLHPQSVLHVHTPQVSAEIRGTIFTFEHYEGETRSEVGVYEGQVAVVAKTAVDDAKRNILRTTIDPVSDLTPLENVLGTGQTLSVDSTERDITIIASNFTANEYNWFKGESQNFANKLGIGLPTLQNALSTAYGGTAQGDGSPSRLTTIQSTKVKTNLGDGFKLVVKTSDDGTDSQGNTTGNPYSAIETTVGVEIPNADGSTTTISRRTVLSLSYDSATGEYDGTVYTQETKETMNADGSFTTTSSVSSNTYDNVPTDTTTWLNADGTVNTTVLNDATPINHTYSSTVNGNADGTSTKTATGTYTDAAGTVTFNETVNVTADANGNLTRDTTRTVTDTNGNPTTYNYTDPSASSATLTVASDANNNILITSTATDANGNTVGTQGAFTYSRNGNTGTITADNGTRSSTTTASLNNRHTTEQLSVTNTTTSTAPDGTTTTVATLSNGTTSTITTSSTTLTDGSTQQTNTVVNTDGTTKTVIITTDPNGNTNTQTTVTDTNGSSTTTTTQGGSTIDPSNPSDIDSLITPTKTVTIDNKPNGGFTRTIVETGTTGSTTTTYDLTVKDNGTRVETNKVLDGSGTTTTLNQTTTVFNTDGGRTITVITDTNGDGILGTGDTSTTTIYNRNGNILDQSSGTIGGGGDSNDIDDGIDGAIDDITDDPNTSP